MDKIISTFALAHCEEYVYLNYHYVGKTKGNSIKSQECGVQSQILPLTVN